MSISCSEEVGQRSTTTVSGQVSSFFNIASVTLTVQVSGRQNLQSSIGSSATYQLNEVPKGERLVYEIFGGGAVKSLSFPQEPGDNINLGYVSSNDFTNLSALFTQQLSKPISQQQGIILGRVSQETRAQVNQVRLRPLVGGNVVVDGPVYFSQDTNTLLLFRLDLTPSSSNITSNGMYAFFNVPEGNYTVVFVDLSGNTVDALDVSVPSLTSTTTLVVGMDVP